ncbi:MAG: 2,3-cyclic-nucleotide 2-phosphodiesterase, partial [Solirubrobacteraceae bacterium]|nr:2,3-cyclic-nucleotide 2-phosphodiesterase [Solirubrobacteraceae bacterium]
MPDAPATILFVGDVVGSLGKHTLLGLLPVLRDRHAPTFVVVNGENAAGGLGITPKIADELFRAGVDVITLGNHAYHRRDILPYLDSKPEILRPYNYLRNQPGHGVCVV